MLTSQQEADLRNLVLYGQEDREEATRRLLIYVESLNRMSQVALLEEVLDAIQDMRACSAATFCGMDHVKSKLAELRGEDYKHQPQSAPDNGGEEVNEP